MDDRPQRYPSRGTVPVPAGVLRLVDRPRQAGRPRTTLRITVSSARGQSLGDKLMRVATEFAQRERLRLVLDVMMKDKSAIRLHERLGWTRIGVTQHDDRASRTVPAICYVSPRLG
jgi:GNAT superfamily N-acetyltransferase